MDKLEEIRAVRDQYNNFNPIHFAVVLVTLVKPTALVLRSEP